MPLNINILWQDYNNVTKYVVFTLLLLITTKNVITKNTIKLLFSNNHNIPTKNYLPIC